MNITPYIILFFSFLVESFYLKKYLNIKNFKEEIENAGSIKCLNLVKSDIRESLGFVLALTMSFIWLSLLSFILIFFSFNLGLIFTVLNIAGFVYFLDQWRYINGLSDPCISKMHKLEEQENLSQ